MWHCDRCRQNIDDTFHACWRCGTSKDGVIDPSFRHADSIPKEAIDLQPHPARSWKPIGTAEKGVLVGAAIPVAATIVSFVLVGILDIATFHSSSMVPVKVGLLVNLPGVVVVVLLEPGFLWGGEDYYLVLLLIMATPISCPVYAIAGGSAGRIYSLIRNKGAANIPQPQSGSPPSGGGTGKMVD